MYKMEPICLQCRYNGLMDNNNSIYVREPAKSQSHLLVGHGHQMWCDVLLYPVLDTVSQSTDTVVQNLLKYNGYWIVLAESG